MEQVTIQEYVRKHGQSQAARDLGMSQPSINRMINSKRQVYVHIEEGRVVAHEIKRVSK